METNHILFYLAPMEGVTGSIVRNAFENNFKGIYKYFTPFVPAGKSWNSKIKRDLDPVNNPGIYLVPQGISNNVEDLLTLEEKLIETGFDEYNLNLGCPSGTVVSKGRGAGMLKDPEALDRFLEELFSRTKMKISLKVRIGLDDVSEWPALLQVLSHHPMEELIIHPRLRSEQYKGTPHLECFDMALQLWKESENHVPLCYNGDIVDMDSFLSIRDTFPEIDRFMIGRGALRRPWLIEELSTGNLPENYWLKLRSFHDFIFENYSEIFSGPKDTLMHMKEIWYYLGEGLNCDKKILKKLFKSREISEYNGITSMIFEDYI